MNTTAKAEKILGQIQAQRETLLADYSTLAQKVQNLKSSTARELNKMVGRATTMLKVKGCQVFLAKDPSEAREQVLKILSTNQKALISKDPIFTEINLHQFLQEKNVKLVQTDLGERVAPLSIDVHPRMASINTSVMDKEHLLQLKNDIREESSQTDFGITGADAIIAETGTIALLESEGNVRLTSNLPYNHIVIAGVEKIVPTLEDALTVCRTSSIYGLGKDLLNYISFISGPSRTADIEFRMVQGMHGPKEVYVILVDNGRMAASKKGEFDALKCLHCGGCLVDCPAYLKKGLKFGYHYSGKRKAILSKFLSGESSPYQEECTYCLDCEKCNTICPVGLKI
ncbi:protein of unknown function DUF162 [Desulforamulus reducens MI-1]|uniref:4Fe-4S ferredoxin-type domain-containing protein n=1 Tax=Desulforamulus reducens (strain ATCC BAA-1160 / DSM 100696 / MI-1) TaxID=349161 RepID=A4J1M5_DESRM|nr:LUD domain-containing protein [Desulforamulus reducens]ABO48978.1 protein of unknown function DUF162 [Desulforamulus reducens MI-1]